MFEKIKEVLNKHKMIAEGLMTFYIASELIYMLDGGLLSRKYLEALIIFISVCVVVHLGFKKLNKKRLRYSLFFAMPFGLAFWLGQKVIYQSVDVQSFTVFDVPLIFALIILFTLMCACVLAFVDSKCYMPKLRATQIFKEHNWLLYSVIILTCWLPLFLVFFPGIVSVDSAVQIRQAIGEGDWSNWHPVLHTLFISIPINIGMNISGDLTTGIALATILQMILLCIIFGYIVRWVVGKTSKKWIGIAFLVFFALNPVIACYSVTMWKDILFSAVFVLLFIKVYDLIEDKKRNNELGLKEILWVLVLVVLVGFLRNGGVLIIVALGVALFVYFRRSRRLIGISFISITVLTILIQGVGYGLLGITSSPFMESMSVPAQQLGYVVQMNEISEEDEQKLSKFADVDCLEKNYSPMNADPAKNCFDYAVVNEDKIGLLRVWLDVLPNNVPEYVKAYILQTYAYWYIQGDVWVLDFGHTHDDLWLREDYADVSLMGDFMRDNIMKVEKGLTSVVWLGWMNNVGVLFWAIMLMTMIFMYQKRYAMLVPLVMVFVYMLSLLVASPVSWIFRYVYSLMLILPVLFTICFIKKKRGGNQ